MQMEESLTSVSHIFVDEVSDLGILGILVRRQSSADLSFQTLRRDIV